MIKVIEFVYFSKCSSPPQAHHHIPLHPSPVCDSTQSPHKRNSISHLSSQNIASHIQPSFPSVAPSTFLFPFYLSTGSFTIRADNFSYLTKQSFQSYLIIKVAHQIIAPEFGSAHSFRLLFFFQLFTLSTEMNLPRVKASSHRQGLGGRIGTTHPVTSYLIGLF